MFLRIVLVWILCGVPSKSISTYSMDERQRKAGVNSLPAPREHARPDRLPVSEHVHRAAIFI
jgi:hypothetical protein